MPTIRIPIELDLSADDEESERLLEAILRGSLDLTPMEVAVECPHGVYQEFGTRPAGKGQAKGASGQPSAVKLKFRQWAAVKCAASAAALGMSTDRFGDMVYHKIMTEGMREHPFFRPAIYDVADRLDEYFTENGRGTKGIADDIMIAAKNNLIINKTNYTGELMNSIAVREISDEPSDEPPNRYEEELWNRLGIEFPGKDGE